MKRKIDLVEEEHESEHEESESSDDESENEEPRIKDALNNLSNAVSRKHASELLHSMAASKNILFWTPTGLLLRNQRAIPVTNISELVEYVLPPHNEDVAKPRALNTFLDGLAELGVNKRLVKNKKLLSDLLEKERGYQDKEDESGNEANDENLSDSSEEEETSSENSQPEESHNSGLENDWEEEEAENSSDSVENSTIAQAKVHDPCRHCNSSHGYDTVVMKCPKCFWEDNCKVCPICDHKIPLERKHAKESLRRCYDCGAITHKDERTSKMTFYPPSDDEDKDD